ncbi:hypothetical protein H112_06155 [Trichophyton rubrum D6]|uniref:Membrane anchor Opy2 N-terminal domain-containing protein n=3 Tax=Trichophyton TaxID=5550 RepID=A0A178ER82_TRIRU|nr:hypothetical protein H100_06169 [Trichophyton rubrum MR850]EZF39837.1 hypothetical protein H102_06138 [Trichophyton rubrum CBS 100081]EZF50465.1 hypothetical protein H103_06162 [Trichophyton rubrum CBS 288.86]EZF61058.1 hypothetical protein H104_06150 [Trichophyton rubrum CBS 289.86]EZF82528.1 hypothetical protein H110_06158 [Trichophyton rubrum MR1448]EZF93210.1 hypothetical protein H113_06204 [Trichophyton rubrum MR1459]EZG04355.1 hypothetical protein H106_05998 [Trichophyton rubrum CBS 
MNPESAIYGRSPSTLFRRCVVNCPTEAPPCPTCKEKEICTLTAKSCEACATAICVPDPLANQPSDDSGSPTGAIAGGVVGGIALLAAILLTWWFCVRRRRKNTEIWHEKTNAASSVDVDGNSQRRQSAVGSIASTVLTRASNVIQIAYIPGVTNRSAPGSPDLMVPPVPPIPSAVANGQNQHFFVPGDIRDSMWSGMTDDDGKSISPSLARSSVATTIYRHNAIVSPVPAQEAYQARANIVSVRSGTSSSSPQSSPKVPSITNSQINKANAVAAKLGVSSIVARSAVAKPINVTKGGRSKTTTSTTTTAATTATLSDNNPSQNTPKVTVGSPERNPSTDSSSSDSSNSKHDATSTTDKQSTAKGKSRQSVQSLAVTEIDDSPDQKQSPFADPIVEEEPIPSGLTSGPTSQSNRSASPFDDKHEVKG